MRKDTTHRRGEEAELRMSSSFYQLNYHSKSIVFSEPKIMGVVNCTPDSFYNGSRFDGRSAAQMAVKMMAQGADIIDLGGQSSRPGAHEISWSEEWVRIQDPIKRILDLNPEALLSIDTFHAEVAEKALDEGAFMINDIYAGTKDGGAMVDVIRQRQCPYIIMHMQGQPQTMQSNPQYEDVTSEVSNWFEERIGSLNSSGINQLVIDVGFGFGKSLEHNFRLLRELEKFRAIKLPILVGISRKSMIWKTLDSTPEKALNGTTALHAWALDRGADLIRVHDVDAAKEVLRLHHSLQGFNGR
ncbi:MAG: dihydropteroate synthase [Bacteroidetes bacterium]|nr:dihydropteroate synthase [Bacteroidota bacterium]